MSSTNFLFDKNPRREEPEFFLGRNLVQQVPEDIPDSTDFAVSLLNALGSIHKDLRSNPDGLAHDQRVKRTLEQVGTFAGPSRDSWDSYYFDALDAPSGFVNPYTEEVHLSTRKIADDYTPSKTSDAPTPGSAAPSMGRVYGSAPGPVGYNETHLTAPTDQMFGVGGGAEEKQADQLKRAELDQRRLTFDRTATTPGDQVNTRPADPEPPGSYKAALMKRMDESPAQESPPPRAAPPPRPPSAPSSASREIYSDGPARNTRSKRRKRK